MRFARLALLLTGLSVLSVASHAQITWSAADPITGDTDVLTNGSLVSAYTIGMTGISSTTVNGVLFSPFVTNQTTSDTVGDITLSSTVDVNGHNSTFGSTSAPFSKLSSAYQSLLASGAQTAPQMAPVALTVTIGDLKKGDGYEVQFWVNDSTATTGPKRTEKITGGPTLAFNTGAGGGVGQFAVGTFKATATTESFTVTGVDPIMTVSPTSQINGIQVRQTSSVPAPGAAVSFILAAAARRRKRSR